MRDLLRDSTYRTAIRATLGVLTVVAAIFLAQLTWPVLQALIIAIVLAAALWPWVTRLTAVSVGPRRWRAPRVLATALIYTVTFATSAAIIWVTLASTVPQMDRLLATYPEQTSSIGQYLEPFRAGNLAAGAAKVAQGVAEQATGQNSGQQASGQQAPLGVNVGALFVGLFGGLVTSALVLVFTFFLLLDGHRFAQWGLLLLPRSERPRARVVGLQIRDRVSRWVLAELIYVCLGGGLVFLGTLVIGIPNPWLYGALGAVFALLPGIGPVTSLIIAFIVSLGLTTWQPLAIAAYAVVFQAIDNTIIIPRTFGQVMRLPALVVLLSVLIGVALLGAWGAVISAPVAVTVETLIREGMGRGEQAAPG